MKRSQQPIVKHGRKAIGSSLRRITRGLRNLALAAPAACGENDCPGAQQGERGWLGDGAEAFVNLPIAQEGQISDHFFERIGFDVR